MSRKKLPLPLLILIISIIIGVLMAGVGLIKQNNAKKTNEERYQNAYKIALENREKLEARYIEITDQIKNLKSQYEAKMQERDSLNMTEANWFEHRSRIEREASEIQSQINKLELEQFQIANDNNFVPYEEVKPITYQIFYIIGGSIAGLGMLAAFIIYLVKGKKTY